MMLIIAVKCVFNECNVLFLSAAHCLWSVEADKSFEYDLLPTFYESFCLFVCFELPRDLDI